MNSKVGFVRVPQQSRSHGLASVIIPSYNKAPHIRATLDSIADQNYPQIEIIVVDDASTDSSVEIVQEWATTAALPVQILVHSRNQGVCRTLNDGLALARGEFVSCVAADDRYLPHKISSHVEILRANPRASFVYGDAQMEDEQGRTLHESMVSAFQHNKFREGDVFHELLGENFIAALTVTMRGTSLDTVGPYDEALPYEDYDMWLRLAQVGELACSGTVDAVYLDTRQSLSKTLGRDLDVGHLQILAKYRDSPRIDQQELDARAIFYAQRAARSGHRPAASIGHLLELARMASIYGDARFVTRALKSEVRNSSVQLTVRARSAVARLMRKHS